MAHLFMLVDGILQWTIRMTLAFSLITYIIVRENHGVTRGSRNSS